MDITRREAIVGGLALGLIPAVALPAEPTETIYLTHNEVEEIGHRIAEGFILNPIKDSQDTINIMAAALNSYGQSNIRLEKWSHLVDKSAAAYIRYLDHNVYCSVMVTTRINYFLCYEKAKDQWVSVEFGIEPSAVPNAPHA